MSTPARRGRRAEKPAAFALRLADCQILVRIEASAALEVISARQRARAAHVASSFLAQHPKFANLDTPFDIVTFTSRR